MDDVLPKKIKNINKTLGRLPKIKHDSSKKLDIITEHNEKTEADTLTNKKSMAES